MSDSGNDRLRRQNQAAHSEVPQTSPANPSDAELGTIIAVFLQHLDLPVNRVRSFLNLTREALESGDPTTPLLYTERAVQQVFSLIRSLERFLQLRQYPMQLKRIDAELAWRGAVKRVEPLMTSRLVELSADPLPEVLGDHAVLELIFTEYLSNALKFTRNQKVALIHMLVQETEGEFLFGVRDNGVGLSPRQQVGLFELFGRQHTARFEGVGLGLVTVRRLVERVGGRAWAEGELDQGATFWIAWPKQSKLELE